MVKKNDEKWESNEVYAGTPMDGRRTEPMVKIGDEARRRFERKGTGQPVWNNGWNGDFGKGGSGSCRA
jgi:hypothetical protein